MGHLAERFSRVYHCHQVCRGRGQGYPWANVLCLRPQEETPMIDSYSFGKMTVNGKEYRKDLIILPDGTVLSPWQRKSGHRLVLEDLDPVLESSVKILVIGTGKPGLMRPHATLVGDLQEKGITAMVLSSNRAAEKYNALSEASDGVAACFHLTC